MRCDFFLEFNDSTFQRIKIFSLLSWMKIFISSHWQQRNLFQLFNKLINYKIITCMNFECANIGQGFHILYFISTESWNKRLRWPNVLFAPSFNERFYFNLTLSPSNNKRQYSISRINYHQVVRNFWII